MTQAVSLLWLFVGSALFGVATRVAIPPTAWIALTVLVHATRSMRAVPGIPYLWLALYLSLAITRRDVMPIHGAIYFVTIAADTTVLTLPFLADRLAAPRLIGVSSTLVFPLAFVAAEFLRSRLTPAASWGSIAYSQYGFLPLMQLASAAGIWGMTFAIGWFASTFELAWSRAFEWTDIRGPVLTCGVMLGAIVLTGYLRLILAPTDRASMRAATLNRPADLFIPGEITRIAEGRVAAGERERVNDKLSRLHDWFLDGSRREARAGARLIAWPEQSLLIFREDEAAFLERARRLAADEHVYLAMGMATVHLGDSRPFENKLVLVDRSGQILFTHLKSRAVPGWEAGIMRRGPGPIPVAATSDGRIAGAICYEADFPDLVHTAGQSGADLLIVPVNEWKEIKYLHLQMQVFRAIENGVPLVRAAASGLSAAVDPWGRVLSVSDFFAGGDRTMTAQVPLGRVPTVYAKTGDLFAWLCVAGLIAVLGLALKAHPSLSAHFSRADVSLAPELRNRNRGHAIRIHCDPPRNGDRRICARYEQLPWQRRILFDIQGATRWHRRRNGRRCYDPTPTQTDDDLAAETFDRRPFRSGGAILPPPIRSDRAIDRPPFRSDGAIEQPPIRST
jgi:apolipoprotein N-acyltransferase